MELSQVITNLNEACWINLAENWDNVGLLAEPTAPHQVSKLMIATELTESVVDEAVASKANLLLVYQPPIFTPVKHMTQSNWRERNIIRCIENRIAVYSPHTCLDSKEDGINDWLLSPFSNVSLAGLIRSLLRTEQQGVRYSTSICQRRYLRGHRCTQRPVSKVFSLATTSPVTRRH
ncbi:NGG1 interacting factor [Cichlidogyrus casuarinus]|uniref:NIF3-like protein 1 n=1 Tax=Cichlidogyrus casuarinus TaxID=1844966 RepID=A0ABD2Q879_9PLAT